MSRPRTLILNDTDAFAGTEQYILALTIALSNLGESVAVACPGHTSLANKLRDAGQVVVPLLPALPGIAALREIIARLRSGEVEILHANNGRTAVFATLAITLAGKGRCICTQHFLQPQYVSRKGFKAIASKMAHRWVDRRIDHLIAISTATKNGVIERGEAAEADITVIPNGIPIPDTALIKSAQSVRSELGLAEGAPLVVCAARLQIEKDIATLIDAMELVVHRFPTAQCVVAGQGHLQEELQTQIDQKRLGQSVRLLGFRADVQSIMNAGDLFVLPSRAEPFGLVLLEAMSLGKPVVATAAGGPQEIVQQGRTGLLVPPGNAKAMAEAITQILASPEIRREMGRSGRERYLSDFTVQRMAVETTAVYQRVATQMRRNTPPLVDGDRAVLEYKSS